jgi:hypothetical protein
MISRYAVYEIELARPLLARHGSAFFLFFLRFHSQVRAENTAGIFYTTQCLRKYNKVYLVGRL